MRLLLLTHITAGSIALIFGFIAVFTLKGAELHRKTGMVFVYSMLVMAAMGATLAILKSQPANIAGGSIALYLVGTGALTFRPRDGRFQWIDAASLTAAALLALLCITLAVQVYQSPTGRINGVPSAPLFVFGGVALLAAIGDARLTLARGIHGRQRLARHIWRMCFALFVASGSFFLGQAKVFPKPIRIIPVLAIPAVFPLLLMIYWLGRVAFTKWYHRLASRPLRVKSIRPAV